MGVAGSLPVDSRRATAPQPRRDWRSHLAVVEEVSKRKRGGEEAEAIRKMRHEEASGSSPGVSSFLKSRGGEESLVEGPSEIARQAWWRCRAKIKLNAKSEYKKINKRD